MISYWDATLYNKIILQETDIAHIVSKGIPNFANNTTTDEGLFASTDDLGQVFYYRGKVMDNYVLFANMCWRIIRTNGDKSVRIIYQGATCSSTGTDATIGSTAYSTGGDDNAYLGYMFGQLNATNYTVAHTNTNNSAIKTKLDSWYTSKLSGFSSFINDSIYCNDRKIATYNGVHGTGAMTTKRGYGKNSTFYAFVDRDRTKSPILSCPQKNDSFTVSNTAIGNGSLTYPIGTISGDELLMSGGYNINTNNTYLHIGVRFWSMTLNNYDAGENGGGNYEYVTMDYGGNPTRGYLEDIRYDSIKYVRPVISLKSDVLVVEGNGLISSPFKIRS